MVSGRVHDHAISPSKQYTERKNLPARFRNVNLSYLIQQLIWVDLRPLLRISHSTCAPSFCHVTQVNGSGVPRPRAWYWLLGWCGRGATLLAGDWRCRAGRGLGGCAAGPAGPAGLFAWWKMVVRVRWCCSSVQSRAHVMCGVIMTSHEAIEGKEEVDLASLPSGEHLLILPTFTLRRLHQSRLMQLVRGWPARYQVTNDMECHLGPRNGPL